MRRVLHIVVAVAVSFAALGGAPRLALADRQEPTSSAPTVIALPQQEPDTQTGRVVIGFDPDREPQVLDLVERLGGTVEQTSDGFAAAVLEPPSGEGADEFAQLVAELPGIEYAETEHGFTIAGVPNDPDYGSQWGLARIGLPVARDLNLGRPSVTVAVVDTGLNFAHVDGPAFVDTTRDWDFVAGDSVAEDENGHGTHVAGIIAAATDNGVGIAGIAPSITILPVKVLDANGRTDNTVDVADGIKWAADRGADVINMSLTTDEDQTIIREACLYAQQRGSLIVAASGNAAAAYSNTAYPAAYAGVLAVGATTSSDARASFSQYGPDLDLVAPGQGILSLALSSSDLAWMTGTSMAAPHVAGVAALVRSAAPTWTASMVTECLISTAEDLGPVGRDDLTGFGLVRADRAVQLAASGRDGQVGDRASLSLSAPSTVAYRAVATLKGQLAVVGAGPVARTTVTIEALPSGAREWKTVGKSVTNAAGGWSTGVKPTRRTEYRAVYAGMPNVLLPAVSGMKAVTPKASITMPKAPKKVYKSRSFTTTGYVKPRPGSNSVKIKTYKYSTAKKRYVLQKTYTAKLKKYNSTTSKYSAKVRFASRGKWKMVAYTKASVQNAATTSAARYRRVR